MKKWTKYQTEYFKVGCGDQTGAMSRILQMNKSLQVSVGIIVHLYFILGNEACDIIHRIRLNKSYFLVLVKYYRFLIEQLSFIEKISHVYESALKIS